MQVTVPNYVAGYLPPFGKQPLQNGYQIDATPDEPKNSLCKL
jgi:hypothetical protein